MPRLQWAYAVVWFLLFLQPRAQDLTTVFLSLPACAQSCGLQYQSQISGSGCTTIQCFCADTSLISVIETCLTSGCTMSDQQKTFQILKPYCPSLANPFSATTSPSLVLSATLSTTATAPKTPTVTTPTVFTTPTIPATPTVISSPTVITTPTTVITPAAPTTHTSSTLTSPTTHSNTTTVAPSAFTGAATLPVANLALVGMGLIGAFHGLL